jgi:hypothetical protein
VNVSLDAVARVFSTPAYVRIEDVSTRITSWRKGEEVLVRTHDEQVFWSCVVK